MQSSRNQRDDCMQLLPATEHACTLVVTAWFKLARSAKIPGRKRRTPDSVPAGMGFGFR